MSKKDEQDNEIKALALGLTAQFLPALAAGTDGGAYIGGGLSVYYRPWILTVTILDSDGMGYNLYGGYQFNRIVGVESYYTDYANYKNSLEKLSPAAYFSYQQT